jgi:hypothetical protein
MQTTKGREMQTVETMPIRRDAVQPGMIVHSSHGYKLLVTEVWDGAVNRTDERHVAIKGHIHADPMREILSERYPAGSTIAVEVGR